MEICMKFIEAKRCRISGSEHLVNVLDLGVQALTGVFPKDKNVPITSGPLRLMWCPDSGLLQLQHTYDLNEMYGDNYGYRSGLPSSSVHGASMLISLGFILKRAPTRG